MPVTNKSSNKIRVAKTFGSDNHFALLDPQVHMKVRRGIDTRYIVGFDSGRTVCRLAKASGGTWIQDAYPHELCIDVIQASGFGYPTSSGCVIFGHKGAWLSGVPVVPGTGTTYLDGTGTPKTFGR